MIRHKYAGPTRYDEIYDPGEGRVPTVTHYELTTVGYLYGAMDEWKFADVLKCVGKKLRKNTNMDQQITLKWSRTFFWESGSGSAHWTTKKEQMILDNLTEKEMR